MRTSEHQEEVRARRARAAVLRDRGVRAVALGASAFFLAYAVAAALVDPDGTSRLILSDGVYLLPWICSTVLCLRAARRLRGSLRRFWLTVALGEGLWLAGDVTWAFIEAILGGDPFPSVADGFYLTGYVVLVAAVIIGFAGQLGHRALRAALDALVVVLPLGFAATRFLLLPTLAGGAALASMVSLSYPLLDLVVLSTVCALAFGGHRRVPRSVGLFAAAMVATAVSDASYTYLELGGSSTVGGWIDLGFVTHALLMCVGATMAACHEEGEPQLRFLARDLVLPLTLAGMAGSLGMLLADAANGGPALASALVTSVGVSALVLRLWLTSRSKDHIAQLLQDSLAAQERLAVTDELTGLANRRFLEAVLRLEADLADRVGRPLGLVVVDLDHFKQVNDRHGHPAGDAVLREAASRLLDAARSSDVVARHGGEEFLVLMPESGEDAIAEIAERIRRSIAARPFRGGEAGAAIRITASIGAASMPHHARDADELVRVADAALYRAKEAGRDRVEVGVAGASPLPAVVGIDALAKEDFVARR